MKFSMSRKYRCVCPTITADPLFSSTTQNDNTSIIIAESPGMRNAAGTNMHDQRNGRKFSLKLLRRMRKQLASKHRESWICGALRLPNYLLRESCARLSEKK